MLISISGISRANTFRFTTSRIDRNEHMNLLQKRRMAASKPSPEAELRTAVVKASQSANQLKNVSANIQKNQAAMQEVVIKTKQSATMIKDMRTRPPIDLSNILYDD